jgi:hypothetical protein
MHISANDGVGYGIISRMLRVQEAYENKARYNKSPGARVRIRFGCSHSSPQVLERETCRLYVKDWFWQYRGKKERMIDASITNTLEQDEGKNSVQLILLNLLN